VIRRNRIIDVDGPSGSNVGGLKLDGCVDCRAEDNVISDIKVGGTRDNQNSAGIHSYDASRTLIQNNTINGAYNGIFHKRSTGGDGLVISRNYISDTRNGVWFSIGGVGDPAHRNQIVFRNIFRDVDVGINAILHETMSQSTDLSIQNNVFMTQLALNVRGFDQVRFIGNIVHGAVINMNMDGRGERSWLRPTTTCSMASSSSRACLAASIQIGPMLVGGSERLAWNRHSVVADPRFRDAFRFMLEADSPARGMGEGRSDIGAYPEANDHIGAREPKVPSCSLKSFEIQ